MQDIKKQSEILRGSFGGTPRRGNAAHSNKKHAKLIALCKAYKHKKTPQDKIMDSHIKSKFERKIPQEVKKMSIDELPIVNLGRTANNMIFCSNENVHDNCPTVTILAQSDVRPMNPPDFWSCSRNDLEMQNMRFDKSDMMGRRREGGEELQPLNDPSEYLSNTWQEELVPPNKVIDDAQKLDPKHFQMQEYHPPQDLYSDSKIPKSKSKAASAGPPQTTLDSIYKFLEFKERSKQNVSSKRFKHKEHPRRNSPFPEIPQWPIREDNFDKKSNSSMSLREAFGDEYNLLEIAENLPGIRELKRKRQEVTESFDKLAEEISSRDGNAFFRDKLVGMICEAKSPSQYQMPPLPKKYHVEPNINRFAFNRMSGPRISTESPVRPKIKTVSSCESTLNKPRKTRTEKLPYPARNEIKAMKPKEVKEVLMNENLDEKTRKTVQEKVIWDDLMAHILRVEYEREHQRNNEQLLGKSSSGEAVQQKPNRTRRLKKKAKAKKGQDLPVFQPTNPMERKNKAAPIKSNKSPDSHANHHEYPLAAHKFDETMLPAASKIIDMQTSTKSYAPEYVDLSQYNTMQNDFQCYFENQIEPRLQSIESFMQNLP